MRWVRSALALLACIVCLIVACAPHATTSASGPVRFGVSPYKQAIGQFSLVQQAAQSGITTVGHLSLPNAPTQNDLLEASISYGGAADPTPPDPGWHILDGPVHCSGVSLVVYYKTAGASEPTSLSFTWPTGVNESISVREVAGAGSFDVHQAQCNSSGTSFLTPILTPTTAGEWAVSAFAFAGSPGTTMPQSGWSEDLVSTNAAAALQGQHYNSLTGAGVISNAVTFGTSVIGASEIALFSSTCLRIGIWYNQFGVSISGNCVPLEPPLHSAWGKQGMQSMPDGDVNKFFVQVTDNSQNVATGPTGTEKGWAHCTWEFTSPHVGCQAFWYNNMSLGEDYISAGCVRNSHPRMDNMDVALVAADTSTLANNMFQHIPSPLPSGGSTPSFANRNRAVGSASCTATVGGGTVAEDLDQIILHRAVFENYATQYETGNLTTDGGILAAAYPWQTPKPSDVPRPPNCDGIQGAFPHRAAADCYGGLYFDQMTAANGRGTGGGLSAPSGPQASMELDPTLYSFDNWTGAFPGVVADTAAFLGDRYHNDGVTKWRVLFNGLSPLLSDTAVASGDPHDNTNGHGITCPVGQAVPSNVVGGDLEGAWLQFAQNGGAKRGPHVSIVAQSINCASDLYAIGKVAQIENYDGRTVNDILVVGGTPRTSDVLTVTINGTVVNYTVKSTDTTTAILATSLAAALDAGVTSLQSSVFGSTVILGSTKVIYPLTVGLSGGATETLTGVVNGNHFDWRITDEALRLIVFNPDLELYELRLYDCDYQGINGMKIGCVYPEGLIYPNSAALRVMGAFTWTTSGPSTTVDNGSACKANVITADGTTGGVNARVVACGHDAQGNDIPVLAVEYPDCVFADVDIGPCAAIVNLTHANVSYASISSQLTNGPYAHMIDCNDINLTQPQCGPSQISVNVAPTPIPAATDGSFFNGTLNGTPGGVIDFGDGFGSGGTICSPETTAHPYGNVPAACPTFSPSTYIFPADGGAAILFKH